MNIKQFDPESGLFLDENKQPLTDDEIRELSFKSNDDTIAKTAFLAILVANQNISVDEWEELYTEEIKREYLRQYTLGIGGQDNLNDEDLAIILALILIQLRFLKAFANRIRAGQLSEAQIRFYMSGYINSSRTAFERAMLNRKLRKSGCPKIVVNLPAMPGDGSTICLSWCRCHWEHVLDNDGCWVASVWVLGVADHCVNCVTRSIVWNPIKFHKTNLNNILYLDILYSIGYNKLN